LDSLFILNWIATIPNYAAPLLLASLGLIICERSGVINLGAEGLMGIGAMSAVLVSFHTQNPGMAVVVGAIASTGLAVVFAVSVVLFKANQVLSGLAIVALGSGITGVVGRAVAHQPVTGFGRIDMGFLTQIPVLGKIMFFQDILIYLCIPLVILTWWVLERSTVGLKLSAVGEDPATADTAGVNVTMYRFVAILISGAFCGLAGAYLSIASSQVWVEGMIAGRGWVAVALVIFARWKPLGALTGAILFAGAEALIPRLQAIGADIPVYLMLALPYVLTLAVLILPAVLFKRPNASPGMLGIDYLRQDRH
jgi:ABC-type uncharacterized transport system permease subunit